MFWTRLISGVILMVFSIALFVFGGEPFTYGKYALAFGLLLISCAGYWELTSGIATKHPEGQERKDLPDARKFHLMDTIGLISIVVYYFVLVIFGLGSYLFVPLVIAILLMMIVFVQRFPKVDTEQVTASVFAYLYCPVMMSFVYMTRTMETYGVYMIWMIMISSWGCDTFAYVFGKLFGKRRVFPLLSPNKSLAGCVGGLASCTVLGGVYGYFYIQRMTGTPYICLATAAICFVGGVMSIFGDLTASAIKRKHGFKDYSKIIPGHGGIMDRFDSVIMVAPTIYLLGTLMFTFVK